MITTDGVMICDCPNEGAIGAHPNSLTCIGRIEAPLDVARLLTLSVLVQDFLLLRFEFTAKISVLRTVSTEWPLEEVAGTEPPLKVTLLSVSVEDFLLRLLLLLSLISTAVVYGRVSLVLR